MNWVCHICKKEFAPKDVHYNAKYGYSFSHCPKCATKVDHPQEPSVFWGALLECAPILLWIVVISGICIYISLHGLKF